MSSAVLYDVQGPRARRRVLVGSVAAGLVLLALAYVAYRRLAANGQFDSALYTPFLQERQLWERLWVGLQNTLKAAAYGLVLALAVGLVLAAGRLAQARWLRVPAVVVIEFFRATPLLLLILFFFLAFPLAFGIRLPPLWALVLGLTLYNGAVIAEIVRAGVQALPRGQTEAALAIGLTRGQALRLVLLPQAVRIMLPSLVSQLVVLLKDTSLGFIIGFEELLRIGGQVTQVLNNPIQVYLVVAAVYVVINLTLSRFAHWLEARQRRRIGSVAVPAEQVETGLGTTAGGTTR